MEPLAVALVWNQEDKTKVEKYIKYTTEMLSYDINKPFSRTINIPIFYFSNYDDKEIPPKIKLEAEKVIVYAFIGINSVSSNEWTKYIDSLYDVKNVKVVLIALDKYAFNISTKVKDYNFIREYEFGEYEEQQLFISMAHEIYRYGFNEKNEIISENSALKIFLSHAKEGKRGLDLAKQLKDIIDNSVIKRFFDSNDIAPGYRFDDEIINNIKKSSIIIINSDVYSSRYWCQREVQVSKEFERPMVEVDLIEKAMDRKFPYAGNVPVIRVDVVNSKVEKDDLYRILENIIIETIRFNYADKKLEMLKQKMTGNIKKMCRPPEMIDLSKILEKEKEIEFNYDKIIYPDPPIYSEEVGFFRKLGIEVYTPIEYENGKLIGKKVGILISDSMEKELRETGQTIKHLYGLSQMISNYILGSGATLIYGGDLRQGGYTELLLQEAQVLKNRLNTADIHIKNYVSWPIYLKDTAEVKKWKAKYKELLKMKEIPIENTVLSLVKSDKEFLYPDTVEKHWIWSKSLTKMRNCMVGECDVCICAGGKKNGYTGKLPGVLEEILIAIERGLPVYLIGGFGGIVHDVCEYLQHGKISDSLTEQWQVENGMEYKELLCKYAENGENIEYDLILKKLKEVNLKNGLTEEENYILFNTVYTDEAVRLILKGLKNL